MRGDVIVVGLGTMGAAAADSLARRGLRVVGLDRFTPPHEHGEHAGGSRIIRLAYGEGAEYVPLLRRAYELWADLEERAEVRLLRSTGALTVGRPDTPLVVGVLAADAAHGLGCTRLSPQETAERYPPFRLSDEEVAVLDPAGGMLAPESAIAACLGLAERAGAQLRRGVAVTGWTATAGGVTVHTDDGNVTGDRLVLCPGTGAPALLGLAGQQLRVEPRMQHYWRPAADPGGYRADRFPAWMWEYEPGRIAYGLPWQEPPGGVKAAFHDALGDAHAMRDWLRDRLPAMAEGAWLGGTECRYTLTPDEHFVVGHHPADERVSVAVGFSGHGFKFMPVVGEVLADLAVDGVTRYPVDMFAPDRFSNQGESAR
jgi:sarcosine oxidase